MFKAEELYAAPEYWLEKTQNELYRQLLDYLEKNNISQTDFANKMGVSKAYVSQVMNGGFNYTLQKLIELSLAIGKAPEISFQNLEDYVTAKSQVIKVGQTVEVSGAKSGKVINISGECLQPTNNSLEQAKYHIA